MSDANLAILLTARDMTAKAFADTQRRLDSLNRVGAMVKNTFAGMAAGFTFGAALRGISGLVDAASNLEEQTSKFNVVFRDNAQAAAEWTRELTQNYAMSTREAREYLAAVQDMLVPMGMASGAAGKMSSDIVKLAADLGSFNNRRTADVMNDIQSALTGQYQTMRKYGVVLSAATVQQEALRLGLAKTKDELTAADKAQAAYELILKGSAAALGDMDRTADSHANTTKRMSAAWEDFSSTLGQKFMPMATRIKGVTADILKNLTDAIQGPGIEAQIAALQAEHAAVLVEMERRQLSANERIERAGEDLKQRVMDRERARMADHMRLLEAQREKEAQMLPRVTEKSGLEMRLEAINRQIDELRAKQINKLLLDAFDLTTVSTPEVKPPEMEMSAYEQELKSWWEEMEAAHDAHWQRQAQDVVAHAQQMAGDAASAWSDAWSLTQSQDWTDQQGTLRQIQELHDRIEALQRGHGTRMSELSKRTAWVMQQSFADLFFDGMQGRMNSFRDYFDSFMRALQRVFAEYMAQMLMKQALGEAAGGTGGGWVGAAANLIVQVATRDSGGPVRPGQMYEIGVPEMLHVGNKSYLMMGGNQSGYAQPLTSAAATPAIENKNTIINVLDPSIVENYLNTPAGEAAVLNVIRRNE